ncbi:MAG: hypothetical protein CSA21_05150 [Deltaproteobacteria bacterium]|nr:MAG: hypothetical protein CSA21_05150 [Deltaproteobacteria bacterium]
MLETEQNQIAAKEPPVFHCPHDTNLPQPPSLSKDDSPWCNRYKRAMHVLRKPPKRFIIVHQGALGDFLMTWPSLAGLRNAFPNLPMLWAGKSSRLPLLHPLEIDMAPAQIHNALRSLYREDTSSSLPPDDYLLWFCLRNKPFQGKHENILFLYGLVPQDMRSPRILYQEQMVHHHLPDAGNWQQTFQAAFPRRTTSPAILLFPGSGNPAKNWPLVQFFELSTWLTSRGWHPVMVLGPVEQEQDIQPPAPLDTIRPPSIEALIDLLQQAAYVIGNDCGPMHLAGYMGIPGISLFGPTSSKQWGPLGMDILSSDLPCSPCTQTASIACTQPVCIQNIPLTKVIAKLETRLTQLSVRPNNKTGS